MDTCFSGAFADGSTTLTRHATTPLALYALKSIGCTVLASSATDELSWEIDGLGNFTRYLDLGLGNDKAQADTNRDHQVTAQELYNYAAPRTTAAEPTQHPTLQVGDNPVLIRY